MFPLEPLIAVNMLCIFGYGMWIDSAGAPTRVTCDRWCSGDREA